MLAPFRDPALAEPAQVQGYAPVRYGYLSPKKAAEFLCVSPDELERLRRIGGGPRFARPLGTRLVRYAVEDLRAWLDSCKVNNLAEAAALAKAQEVAGV